MKNGRKSTKINTFPIGAQILTPHIFGRIDRQAIFKLDNIFGCSRGRVPQFVLWTSIVDVNIFQAIFA